MNPADYFPESTPVCVRGRLVSGGGDGDHLLEPDLGHHALALEADPATVPIVAGNRGALVDVSGSVMGSRLHATAVAPAPATNALQHSLEELKAKVVARSARVTRQTPTPAEELVGMVERLRREGLVMASTRLRVSPARVILTVSTTEPALVGTRMEAAVRDGLVVVLPSRWGHATLEEARAAAADIDESNVIVTGEAINENGELFVHVKTKGPVEVSLPRQGRSAQDEVLRVQSWITPVGGVPEGADRREPGAR